MIFPVMITLQEIRDHSPCRSGWEKVLSANGGVNADMSKQFELSSIIDSNSVADCMWSLQCKPEYFSLWRKLAVVFADEVKHLMTDERSIKALDVAWLHSECRASDEELAAAAHAAHAAAYADARQKQAEILRKALTTGIVERTK